MEKTLREFCLHHGLTAIWNCSLSDYTSFRIGGTADAFILPDNEVNFLILLRFLREKDIPFRIIGNGTNILFADEGFRGVIISTRHMRGISVVENTVRVSAGVPLNVLCRTLADCALGGMETLYGIPGTVGGALIMNAGAFGSTVSDHLSFVSVFRAASGCVETLSKRAMDFSYRRSRLKEEIHSAVLSAEFILPHSDSEKIREKMRQILKKRMETQPTALPSAGSTFLRPKEGCAAEWIQKAGLCGKRIGGAAVSLKHTGFLVNLGGATAKDVISLIAEIQKEVWERFSVELVPEIEYIK